MTANGTTPRDGRAMEGPERRWATMEIPVALFWFLLLTCVVLFWLAVLGLWTCAVAAEPEATVHWDLTLRWEQEPSQHVLAEARESVWRIYQRTDPQAFVVVKAGIPNAIVYVCVQLPYPPMPKHRL